MQPAGITLLLLSELLVAAPRAIVAAYFANVRSVLEYCSVVWNGAAGSHIDRIERIQHTFLIRLTVHSTRNSYSLSCNSLLSAHSFTYLAARRSQHDVYMYFFWNGSSSTKLTRQPCDPALAWPFRPVPCDTVICSQSHLPALRLSRMTSFVGYRGR